MWKITIVSILALLVLGYVSYELPVFLSDSVLSRITRTLTTLITILALVGIVPVIVSLYDLREKRKRETNEYILSALSFFRVEIIGLDRKLFDEAKKLNITIPNLGSLAKDTTFSLSEMSSLSEKKFREYNDMLVKNNILAEITIELLNALEELSARIVLPKNSNHVAYQTISPVFIETVEKNAIMLYMLKHFNDRDFPHIISLYKLWKPEENTPALMTNEERIKHNVEKIRNALGRP